MSSEFQLRRAIGRDTEGRADRLRSTPAKNKARKEREAAKLAHSTSTAQNWAKATTRRPKLQKANEEQASKTHATTETTESRNSQRQL